jgi:hypothetical protein
MKKIHNKLTSYTTLTFKHRRAGSRQKFATQQLQVPHVHSL